MILVSGILDALAALGGPRVRHALYINRLMRWGRGDQEWRVLEHLVDRSRPAVDVGANAGIYAGRLSKLCPRVHAFEPIPWLADALRNQMRSNVTVHRIALSDRAGEAKLRIPTEDICLTTIDDNNPLAPGLHIKVVSCQVARLDDVISDPVGFIKIDVEGHEMAVLEGALQLIRKNRPTFVVESEHTHNPAAPQNVFDFMKREGYSGVYLRHGIPYALSTTTPGGIVNYIFFPSEDPRTKQFLGVPVSVEQAINPDLVQLERIASQRTTPTGL